MNWQVIIPIAQKFRINSIIWLYMCVDADICELVGEFWQFPIHIGMQALFWSWFFSIAKLQKLKARSIALPFYSTRYHKQDMDIGILTYKLEAVELGKSCSTTIKNMKWIFVRCFACGWECKRQSNENRKFWQNGKQEKHTHTFAYSHSHIFSLCHTHTHIFTTLYLPAPEVNG